MEKGEAWEQGNNTQGVFSDIWFQIKEREDPFQKLSIPTEPRQ